MNTVYIVHEQHPLQCGVESKQKQPHCTHEFTCTCTAVCVPYYVGVGDGLVAEIPNPAVSSSLLQEIQQMKVNGLTEQDIFSRLRSRTVPAGYAYTTWKPGMVTMSVLHAHVHILYG